MLVGIGVEQSWKCFTWCESSTLPSPSPNEKSCQWWTPHWRRQAQLPRDIPSAMCLIIVHAYFCTEFHQQKLTCSPSQILGRTKHLIKDGWISGSQSHERSLLKNCKASKTWTFFPEAASWMRKPRFRCLNLFLWQFQCIPKGSKELFNFNGCRRKNLVSKELTSLTCWYTFALAGSL